MGVGAVRLQRVVVVVVVVASVGVQAEDGRLDAHAGDLDGAVGAQPDGLRRQVQVVQAAPGARVQRLGDLADEGAHLRRVQALTDQGGQGAPVGGLGDDEGGVVLLDVEDPLNALVLHQDGAAGRLQDLGTVGSRIGEHEDRHRAV